MNTKKIIAGLMALMFVFRGTALPKLPTAFDTAVTASAFYETYGNFNYIVDHEKNTIMIDGFKDGYDDSETNIVIPSEIDGKPVTEILDEAFKCHSEIKSVVLPDGLIEIG